MSRFLALLCGLTFLGALLADTATAQQWTRFRGPNGDGQSETEFPAQWSERDFVWKVSLPGAGFSSPVLWRDKIFLTSADDAKAQRSLLCLATADGKLLWKRDFPFQSYHKHAQNGFASSTPVVDARHVYCAWATPEQYYVVALNHEGTEIWRTELGPFPSAHGYAASPMIYENLLIVTNDQDGESSLQALDCKDGKIVWRVPRRHRDEQNASYSVPCIYQPAKGPAELIHNSWAHGISSLNPRTGKTNWELPVLERRSVSSPIIVDGLVFGSCGEGGGKNTMVAVRPGSQGGQQPELAYKLDKAYAAYVPTMVAHGHLVFLWSERGIVSCIDAATGAIHYRERVGGNYHGSPVRAGNKIYCISHEGEVVSIAAGDKFEVLGRTPLNETSRSTPAIDDGRMYLRTESHLVCVQGKAK